MAKGGARGKSSASSATRKKQASKAAKKTAFERDDDGNLLHPDLAEAFEKQKQHGLQRGQKKDKSKDKDGKGSGKKDKRDKKKQYIPPSKPPQPLPDPLDSMMLASLLPGDLVVLLRKASKKDVITRCRALEGLLAWVEDALGRPRSQNAAPPAHPEAHDAPQPEESGLTLADKQEALVMMLPCWIHLFPRLALSPARRLRLLTVQIHSLLLQQPQQHSSEHLSSTRAELLESPQYIEPVLGPWAILCHDTDRSIERLGKTAWINSCSYINSTESSDASTSHPPAVRLNLLDHLDTLLGHLRTILLSPSPSFALSMTAAHAPTETAMSRSSSGHAISLATPSHERDAKNRDDANVEEDSAALDKRLVAGALSVLTSIVAEHPSPKPAEVLAELLSSRMVWSCLSPFDLCSPAAASRKSKSASPNAGNTSFGYDAPPVRSRAWTLLRTLQGQLPSAIDDNIAIVQAMAMTAAWQERDLGVQRTMLDAILLLLKARPHLWLDGANARNGRAHTDESDKDSEDEDFYEEDDDEDSRDNKGAGDSEAEGNSDETEEDTASKALQQRRRPPSTSYIAFLQWLQAACGGGPLLGYPAVVVFVSTIPAEVLPYDDLESNSDLLTHLFSALYSRALDNDHSGCRAFFSAFTESVTFLTVRMYRSSGASNVEEQAQQLAHVHLSSALKELVIDPALLVSALDGATGLPDEETRARLQRIKSISGPRIVSDLANQFRGLAGVAPDLVLIRPTLTALQSNIATLAIYVSKASAQQLLQDDKAILRGSLERAITLMTTLLQPSSLPAFSQQLAQAQLSSAVSTIVHELLKGTAGAMTYIATDAAASATVRRFRADLLTELMSLLLRALVDSPDDADAFKLEELDHVASVVVPELTASQSITPSSAASLLAAYLPVCRSLETRASIWTETLASVVELPELGDQVDAMSELLGAAQKFGQQIDLPVPRSDSGVANLFYTMLTCLCDDTNLSDDLRVRIRGVAARVVASPRPFVDEEVGDTMLFTVANASARLRTALITHKPLDREATLERTKSAVVLRDLLECLDAWLQARSGQAAADTLLDRDATADIVTAVSDLALLTAVYADVSIAHSLAEKSAYLWNRILQESDIPTRKRCLQAALSSLKRHLIELRVPVVSLVSAAQSVCQQLAESSALAVLPSESELTAMLVHTARKAPHTALAVFDPLVTAQSGLTHATSVTEVDSDGLSTYARVCIAVFFIFEQDRSAARQRASLLAHIILLAILIEDDLLLGGASRHSLVSSGVEQHRSWLQRAVAVATGLASSLSDSVTENWHNDTVAVLQRGQLIETHTDGLGHVLSTLWQLASREDLGNSSYLARIFSRLLSAAFDFGSANEPGADRWLRLGDAVQDKLPALSRAISFASKKVAATSPIYDRLRNASAANLGSLRPSTSSGKLLQALRRLIALAPALDSDLSLVPQQRAIFLLKNLQTLYGREDLTDELDDEVSTRLAEVFIHLIPVVQDVQGSHFDFIFDIVETNLEFCSLNEVETVAQLHASLRLLETLRDYALRSATLREYWKDRKVISLQLVRDHFLSLSGTSASEVGGDVRHLELATSAPRQACAELIVELIREVPSSSFDLAQTGTSLCRLMVEGPSHEVQVISYRLLSISIKNHVQKLVVEVAIGNKAGQTEDVAAGEGTIEAASKLNAKLPASLLANVVDSLSPQLDLLVEEEAARQTALGYFLSWIAIFDHFESASLSIKSAYVGELEKRGLLSGSLLPTVFALVGLADETRRPFDPSRFVIEEVFLDQIDVSSSLTVLQVLAAHVYLRALIHMPTTVRGWWVDIKDRQLSMQISGFTTRHCSPVIASRELAHLREPAALSKLQDEALTIKILSTNEVIATYVVDEHPMEIGVKIPPDFPLHGVEIRDIQRVGITEAKWRSWLLAVQQLITGQNGLIFDALSLFKRNAEVQFQGLEECAICYSIISPMDRSLPTKPCKTCKNKFHAGCLFKWISTSGASTCPLCRSIL